VPGAGASDVVVTTVLDGTLAQGAGAAVAA
jgi:hypothetical protein